MEAHNPARHLHLVTNRPPEQWASAYIALHDATLTYDENKGTNFRKYAATKIGYACLDQMIEEVSGRKNRRTIKNGKFQATTLRLIGDTAAPKPEEVPEHKPLPLPPKLREVADLYRRGLSQYQIAAALGMAPAGIYGRMRELRKRYGTKSTRGLSQKQRLGREDAATGEAHGGSIPPQARCA